MAREWGVARMALRLIAARLSAGNRVPELSLIPAAISRPNERTASMEALQPTYLPTSRTDAIADVEHGFEKVHWDPTKSHAVRDMCLRMHCTG